MKFSASSFRDGKAAEKRPLSLIFDSVSMYLSPERQESVIRDILRIKPEKVIFNPGAENQEAYERIRESGIRVVEACALVLLSTGQFDEA